MWLLFAVESHLTGTSLAAECGDAAGISDAESTAGGEFLSALGKLGSSWLLLCVYMQKSEGPQHSEEGASWLIDWDAQPPQLHPQPTSCAPLSLFLFFFKSGLLCHT